MQFPVRSTEYHTNQLSPDERSFRHAAPCRPALARQNANVRCVVLGEYYKGSLNAIYVVRLAWGPVVKVRSALARRPLPRTQRLLVEPDPKVLTISNNFTHKV